MSDKEVIQTTIDALGVDDLATDEEKIKKVKSKKVDLTPAIVNQVVDLIQSGTPIGQIKKTVVEVGPQGQQWKLSNAQVREIAQYRAQRYAELTATDDPIEP
jgi:hypothetical protein